MGRNAEGQGIDPKTLDSVSKDYTIRWNVEAAVRSLDMTLPSKSCTLKPKLLAGGFSLWRSRILRRSVVRGRRDSIGNGRGPAPISQHTSRRGPLQHLRLRV